MAKELKKYLVVYHSPASAMKKMKTATPAEMQAGWQAWMKWAERCGPSLLEMGAPLAGGVNIKGKEPSTPSKRKVSGYSILQAASLSAAQKLLKNHPHLSWAKGCEIEVHEAMKMG